MSFKEKLIDCGAIWRHDGNPKRPYALLTSGRISNGFVDCSPAVMRPQLIAEASKHLALQLRKRVAKRVFCKLIVAGQMKGSVTLASRIAEELGCLFIWMDKSSDASDKEMPLDPRFNSHLLPYSDHTVLLIEDVTTTCSTSKKSRETLHRLGFSTLPYLLALVNRSVKIEMQGFRIISCTDIEMQDWERGKNPFTKGGEEYVEPVRPKGHDGHLLWKEL